MICQFIQLMYCYVMFYPINVSILLGSHSQLLTFDGYYFLLIQLSYGRHAGNCRPLHCYRPGSRAPDSRQTVTRAPGSRVPGYRPSGSRGRRCPRCCGRRIEEGHPALHVQVRVAEGRGYFSLKGQRH